MELVVKCYPPFIVWPPGQRISGICFTRSVGECEVVFLEELFPSSLSAREILRFAEIDEVLMIGEDLKWVSSTEEIVSPFCESKDDSCHL